METTLFGYPAKVEDYNSNNDWGFGGLMGKKYIFNEHLHLRTGLLCFRHLPKKPITTIWQDKEHDGNFVKILDEPNNLSTKDLQNKCIKLLKTIIL